MTRNSTPCHYDIGSIEHAQTESHHAQQWTAGVVPDGRNMQGWMMDLEPIADAALPLKVDHAAPAARAGALGFDAGAAAAEAASARLRSGPRPAFRFLVSQDEEHVRLELRVDGRAVDLGERAHHQTLLLLARERRDDEAQGVISSEAGWRDVALLGAMLGIDAQHINTHLFRALRQLSPVLRESAIVLDLVERRRGQIRFGDTGFAVVDWRGVALVRT
jgi:hypothetical protein